jgi:hypothetical protein
LEPTTTIHGLAGRVRSLAAAAAAVILVALPASAQDATETTAPETGAPASAAPSTPGIAFPVMLGGQLLTPQTYTGSEWLDQFREGDAADPAFVGDTEALLESVGADIDDLTVKTALYELTPAVTTETEEGIETTPAEVAVVAALRIDGTDARDWVEQAVDVMVGDVLEPGLVMRPIDTKWVLRVTDTSMPGVYPRTVYLKDDTAWIVQGDENYVWDALGQLPEPDPVMPSSADSLYTDVPLTLGGVRRMGLYESTEPLFLPTLGERIGDTFEDWLLDLYLGTGMTPAEMLGVITWWGLDAAQDGIQIEGYRLPEGGEAMTQRLFEDVFLVRPPEVSVDTDEDSLGELDDISAMLSGVEFSDEDIAGQAVTVLDYAGPKQYIFSSADTIWVISDPLDERALVEEAVEALP